MKIVNIDAPANLVTKVSKLGLPGFVLDVVRPLERKYYSSRKFKCSLPQFTTNGYPRLLPSFPIWKFAEPRYENVAILIHTIPIYLRDSRPERKGDNCIIDLLGAYFSNQKGDSPYIELYLKEIDNSVNSDNEFRWLFTKVLLHELAHAALDIFNLEFCHVYVEKVSYNSTFGRWREESMANAVALRIIKDYKDQAFYDFAKDFMLAQDPEYALGVKMLNSLFGFTIIDFLSVFNGKMKGVSTELQEDWLQYAKGKPSCKELHRWNQLLYWYSGGNMPVRI